MPEPIMTPVAQRPSSSSMPTPSGRATPMPVTPTRLGAEPFANTLQPLRVRCRGAGDGAAPSGGLLLLDVVDRVLDGGDLLRRVVRDLHAEGLLKRHHQLHRVQAVGAEVVDEGRLRRDLRLVHAEVLDDDLLHLVGGLAHGLTVSWFPRPRAAGGPPPGPGGGGGP